MSEDPPSGHKLPEPIKINLGDNPGVVEFETFENALEWARLQHDWSTATFRKKVNHQPFHNMYDLQEAPSEIIRDAANNIISENGDAKDAGEKIKEALNIFKNHEALHQESPQGQLCEQISNSQPWGAPGCLSAFLGYPPMDFVGSFSGDQMTQFVGGYQMIQSAFPSLRGKEATSIRHTLHQLQQEEIKLSAERVDRFNNLVQELEGKTKQLEEEASKQKAALDALHGAYDEYMKLKSPANYWRERAEASEKKVVGWSKYFVIVAVIGLVGAIFGYPAVLTNFKGTDGTLGAGTIGLITAPAVIFLSVLGLLYRAISGWLRDATAANERHTMIMTYIAFAGDENNPMDEGHRQHILDRLFTPTMESGLKDFTNPYIEGIRELRKSASGKE